MQQDGKTTRSRDLIRVVSAFEAAKGLIVLVTGFGLLLFIHKDLHSVAEQIVRHLHLNPARHHPNVFIDAINHITDPQRIALALSAFLYSLIRLVEAYGLWHRRQWAEWFGLLSGGVYIPVEFYELVRSATMIKLTILIVNLFIVILLGQIVYRSRRER